MAWDVTVPDTDAQSHINDISIQAGTAADSAAATKKAKYTDIANTHMFIPVAIEMGEPWNVEATELIQEIGRRITLVNGEPRETEYLFQRISIAIQKATIWPTRAPFKPNPIFNPKEDHVKQAPYLIKFTSLQALCWWAKKKKIKKIIIIVIIMTGF